MIIQRHFDDKTGFIVKDLQCKKEECVQVLSIKIFYIMYTTLKGYPVICIPQCTRGYSQKSVDVID